MHYTQNIITIRNGIDNYPDCKYVIYLVHCTTFHVSLFVNPVNTLYSAFNIHVIYLIFQAFIQSLLYLRYKINSISAFRFKLSFYLLIAYGVKIAYRQIFQFFLDCPDTQSMSYRCIHFHDFECFISPVLFLHAVDCSHIVQSVRQLDNNYPYIIRHRYEHFTDIFRLLFFS